MYVYICVYIYIYIYTYIMVMYDIYTYIYIYIHIHTYMHTYIHTYIKNDVFIHPFTFDCLDVPTGVTSVTTARCVRIDAIMYESQR